MFQTIGLLNASWQMYIAPAAAAAVILAAAAGYWFWGRDRRLQAVETDTIPDGLSALELGTAMDSIVQGEDLGAQVMDWASRGHLTLSIGAGSWRLQPGSKPVEADRPYRAEAWAALFGSGDASVSLPEQRSAMLKAARILQQGAEDLFQTGEKRMTDTVSSRMALAVWCIGVLCMLTSGALAGWQQGLNAYGIVPMAIAAALPAVLASWLSGWFQRFYQVRTRRRNYLVIAALVMGDLLMILLTDALLLEVSPVAPWVLTPLICAGIFCAMLAPFVGRRSRYGYELLCGIMGFRDALASGEKMPDRRPGESVDDYFFRMFPYAHVVGVGDEFVARYADRPLTAPAWLIWEGREPLTAKSLLRCLNDIRDQLVNGREDGQTGEEI